MSPASDERLARVEGILEEVRTRLNHLESRFTSFEARLESRFTALESRGQTQFYWVLGILITMWVTIMMGIFGTLAAILFR